MKNSNNNVKLVGAILLGAAIGGALGILFAPEKGSETRKKLSAKGNGLTDTMKEKVEEFLDEFRKEKEIVKEKTNEFIENGKAAMEEFKTG